MNECATNNGGCAHICTDMEGSFICSYRSRFEVVGNGLGCNGRVRVSGIQGQNLHNMFIQVFRVEGGDIPQ